MFKQVDDVQDMQACDLLCYLNDDPCNIYVYLNNVCYMGDYHVNANIVTDGTYMYQYERKGKNDQVIRP